MNDIVVVGSMNMDFVFSVERYPQRGETITGNRFMITPGGKGANQAASIAKLGGKVSFVGARGNDINGEELMANLKDLGVNVENVLCFEDTTTGVAAITLESKGENRIIIVPGANNKLSLSTVEHFREAIRKAQVVLLQLEIPLETVIKTIEIAHDYQTKVVLDPAPAKELPEEIYQKIDYLLPNEGEINQLCKRYNLETEKEKIHKLLDLGVGSIIITKGEQGAIYYARDQIIQQPAIKTKVVDTTGAGDAFAGGFAFGLQKGWEIKDIMKFASCVAGLSVTKHGAQNSAPTMAEVEEMFS
mgnify:CR=1 FL=1